MLIQRKLLEQKYKPFYVPKIIPEKRIKTNETAACFKNIPKINNRMINYKIF
jgi:hypothetical protein